jgi:hypothetical protein
LPPGIPAFITIADYYLKTFSCLRLISRSEKLHG